MPFLRFGCRPGAAACRRAAGKVPRLSRETLSNFNAASSRLPASRAQAGTCVVVTSAMIRPSAPVTDVRTTVSRRPFFTNRAVARKVPLF